MGKKHTAFVLALIWHNPSCLALIPPPCSYSATEKSIQFTLLSNASRQNIAFHAHAPSNNKNSSNNIPRCDDTSNIMYTPQRIFHSIKQGYAQRLAADPSFLSKSILEIILAAVTQYTAEVGRRGRHRILPEFDFVVAGILTAVCGKYYSMWRVAKTVSNEDISESSAIKMSNETKWRDLIPTNAFQSTLLDGKTKPTLSSRILALLLPMPELFRAGVIASTIGYGLTSLLIKLRSVLIPQYVANTVPVPVWGAAVYTGVFMALVSNIRYQLLQGVVEPYLIEEPFCRIQVFGEKLKTERGVVGRIGLLLSWGGWNKVEGFMIVLVRWLNGLLGSWIAIGGMKACGLQKVKS